MFLAVSSCLHSILDYAERIELDERDKSLIFAFRYANNSLKHCIEIKTIAAPRGGLVFPTHFPLAIPKRRIIWSIVGNEDPKYENQRIRYKDLLKEIRINIISGKYEIDDVIEYLLKREYEVKDIRVSIRSFLQDKYYQSNETKIKFVAAIYGIMECYKEY